jgi:hypothetical protein
VCCAPAVMAVTPLKPRTVTGDGEQGYGGVTLHNGKLLLLATPSWPTSFAPQQTTVPPDSSAQTWRAPAAIAIAPLNPATGTGKGEQGAPWHMSGPPSDPTPSSPNSFDPQQSTLPVESKAQSAPPAVMAVAPLKPGTGEGRVAMPLPQQRTSPVGISSHAWPCPTASATPALPAGQKPASGTDIESISVRAPQPTPTAMANLKHQPKRRTSEAYRAGGAFASGCRSSRYWGWRRETTKRDKASSGGGVRNSTGERAVDGPAPLRSLR